MVIWVDSSSHRQKRVGIIPLAFFLLKFFAFVDQNLHVIRQANFKTLKRPGRWAFKINPGFKKSASMAGTFKFVFGLKPVGRTTQVGTYGRKRVDSFRHSDNPRPILFLPAF